MAKRKFDSEIQDTISTKKIKKIREEKPDVKSQISKEPKSASEKKPNFSKDHKKGGPKSAVNAPKKFSKPTKKVPDLTEKPEDWNKFKEEKKELKLKRKQQKTSFDVVVKAKKIGEKLRCKTLKGGQDERNNLINELHSMLKGQQLYSKFVVAHDTSRIVQWLLKYSSSIVKEQISKELIPVTVKMMMSKYATHCVRRLIKYGNTDTKSAIVGAMYGNAVKLASHSLCAPVLELAYTTCATPLQKQHLAQEFYSEMYKNTKDDMVKHLRDVYSTSVELKQAALSATKANLLRVIAKNSLDSGLVQTVLHQYFSECSNEDKAELISELVPHIVVISNSKDGAKVAMQCIWCGTNKDRKTAMKTMKEHVVEMSKHEHAHCVVISLLDTADDTVLLHKIILGEILKSSRDLAVTDWGRKVLLWLVAPADPTCFHPVFVKELDEGRQRSTSKKTSDIRRKEILGYSSGTLLGLVEEEPEFWLRNSSLAYEMLAIIKAGNGEESQNAIKSIVKVVMDPSWIIKVKDVEVSGIEDAGLHMVIKKLAKHNSQDDGSFSACLAEALTDDTLQAWLILNRGCFVLVTAYENSSSQIQEIFKNKLQPHLKLLKKQSTQGAKILLKKIT